MLVNPKFFQIGSLLTMRNNPFRFPRKIPQRSKQSSAIHFSHYKRKEHTIFRKCEHVYVITEKYNGRH